MSAPRSSYLLLYLVATLPLTGARAEPRGAPGPHHQHDAHRFDDAGRWAREFESPTRDRWQKPGAVIAALQLRGDERVVDIGAGTGYFAVRLARALPRGTVYGVDVEESMTHYLAQRAARESLANLRALRGAPDDPRLPTTVDLVFICNTYHHLPDRASYFARLARRLRHGARLAVVDFKGGRLPVGPPESERVLPAQLDRELAAAGFARLSLDEKLLPHQYLAIYRAAPPARPPHPDRACEKDGDCGLLGDDPCRCPSCASHWYEALNQRALGARRSAWAARRCSRPLCSDCPVEGERLGRRAKCLRGQCVVE